VKSETTHVTIVLLTGTRVGDVAVDVDQRGRYGDRMTAAGMGWDGMKSENVAGTVWGWRQEVRGQIGTGTHV